MCNVDCERLDDVYAMRCYESIAGEECGVQGGRLYGAGGWSKGE